MSETEQLVVPYDIIKKALGKWWLALIFLAIGVGLGAIYHVFNPPLYQARAVLEVGIDVTKTGRLSDIEEDHVLGVVGDIAASEDVLMLLMDNMMDEDKAVGREALKEMLSIERQNNSWFLEIRHSDPDFVVYLTNLWAETAIDYFSSVYDYAEEAVVMARAEDALEDCFQSVVLQPVYAGCAEYGLDDKEELVRQSSMDITAKRLSSMGLLPGTSLSVVNWAEKPTKPVNYGMEELVISGGFLGLIVFIGLILVYYT